ncbi:MAG: M20 family metallopeptidase [Filifactor alocis]|nr:M20 family metallopeptidase [Filifactor alocis]
MRDRIFAEVDRMSEELIAHRRYLHQNPETGFETLETEAYIRDFLISEGIEVLDSTIGVLGVIRSRKEDGFIALRADIDALDLDEMTQLEYSSKKEGRMHACGHDGHTAMLMACAKVLQKYRDSLKYNVLLLFQPAEEGPNLGGARIMLMDLEALELLPKIKAMYALHLNCELHTGVFGVRYGSSMASTDEFSIDIIGKGGHPGEPQYNVDAISVASKFIAGIESFLAKNKDPLDPAVFSIGMIRGGSARNVVSEHCNLQGTIRCQSEETRGRILDHMEKLLQGICLYSGARYELDLLHGLPVLHNDTELMSFVEERIDKHFGKEAKHIYDKPRMGAEDFSYFAQKLPVAFIWVGARNEELGCIYNMHNPKFNIDERALAYGTKLLAMLVMDSM